MIRRMKNGSCYCFDVSMGKSIMVIYGSYQRCQYEGELEHTVAGFQALKEQIESIREQDNQVPEIVFEAIGVYSQGLERFIQEAHYSYTRLNPLQAKQQMATGSMRRNKTDISDAHELAKSHFKADRGTEIPEERNHQTNGSTFKRTYRISSTSFISGNW